MVVASEHAEGAHGDDLIFGFPRHKPAGQRGERRGRDNGLRDEDMAVEGVGGIARPATRPPGVSLWDVRRPVHLGISSRPNLIIRFARLARILALFLHQ